MSEDETDILVEECRRYLECWLGRSLSFWGWLLDEGRAGAVDAPERSDEMLELAALAFRCYSRPFLLPSTSVLAFVGSDHRTP